MHGRAGVPHRARTLINQITYFPCSYCKKPATYKHENDQSYTVLRLIRTDITYSDRTPTRKARPRHRKSVVKEAHP